MMFVSKLSARFTKASDNTRAYEQWNPEYFDREKNRNNPFTTSHKLSICDASVIF